MLYRLAALAFALMTATAGAQTASPLPGGVDLQPVDPATLWTTQNSRLEVGDEGGAPVYRWHLAAGQEAELAIRQDHPLLQQLRYYDYLTFEVRIASGDVGEVSLNLLGVSSGPRQYKVHNWPVAILTTAKGVWLRRGFELARPNWFPWDNPDGQGVDAFFRLSAMALSPETVVELRGMYLSRALIRLKPDFVPPVTWPVLSRDDDGNAVYTFTHEVLNQANRSLDIEAEVVSSHARFQVSIEPAKAENVKNGKTASFSVKATLSAADEAALPDLYAEPLTIVFRPADARDAAVWWHGELTRPLSAGVRRQVLVKPETLALLREKLPADEALQALVKPQAAISGADEFLGKELLRLPTGHLHVSNNWVGDWRPAERMPEIVNLKTGERQFDTAIAARTWKEYLGQRGRAMEHLTDAYLFTGDEKYALKAIALFELYAQQYTDLDWASFFEPTWSDGPAILASTRVALSSSYGTNWYFKGHCRLLSAIADSPSWTDEARDRVYRRFVLPYATELMKFRGGISNMTDITNHNILLLGIAFRDANLVRWALYTDAGLLRRLDDISPDGFSSEGRPLNYHHAAMSEYLPALAFLDHANLAADFPRERLLAAIRMPYLRANAEGFVPATGDSGRGFRVGKRAEADWLVGMFPEETWLFDLGNLTTIEAQLAAWRSGRKPAADAWKQLLGTGSVRFADAGYAILRQGESTADQVMVTLDYGRNPMHAHLDRNTISLSAFGHLFTQGPGSLYNIGRGGMTRHEELDRTVSSGSLSQNVILVDRQNQLPAVGECLVWQPDGEQQTVVARVPSLRPGVDHTRAVVLRDGIVVVLDRLVSDADHTYDFVYHNYGDLTLGNGWTAAAVTEPLGTMANYESLIAPQRLAGAGPIRLGWKVAENVHLALWQLPGGEAYTAVTGLNNLQTATMPQPAPTLIHRRQGKTVYYLTVLEPWRDQPRVTAVAPNGESGVTLSLRDGTTFAIDLAALLPKP